MECKKKTKKVKMEWKKRQETGDGGREKGGDGGMVETGEWRRIKIRYNRGQNKEGRQSRQRDGKEGEK